MLASARLFSDIHVLWPCSPAGLQVLLRHSWSVFNRSSQKPGLPTTASKNYGSFRHSYLVNALFSVNSRVPITDPISWKGRSIDSGSSARLSLKQWGSTLYLGLLVMVREAAGSLGGSTCSLQPAPRLNKQQTRQPSPLLDLDKPSRQPDYPSLNFTKAVPLAEHPHNRQNGKLIPFLSVPSPSCPSASPSLTPPNSS